MTNQIQGIDPIMSGEDLDLFLPYPYCGSVAMDQYKGFSLSFNNVKNSLSFNLYGLRRKGGVPVNPVRPDQGDAASP
jgi:hypothetical protein